MNIILITVDTLRMDVLGCYGHTRRLTPNIDRLAQQGARFSQSITGGTWTQAAFPTMLTATYASMYGGCLGVLSEERPSPVTTLSQAGYATAGFSSNFLVGRRYHYDRGFDYFADLEPQGRDPRLRSMKGGQALLR
ncbi:MAG: sulfatase-like hydrolase/transferase, partial [Methylococcales bacterium]|nr:sulfatase-like hydrolase/transferase [Methylococcales bacterium]